MNGFSETCIHTTDCSSCEFGYKVCDGTGCVDYEVIDKDML